MICYFRPDKLPQLLCILAEAMSLLGRRPELDVFYREFEKRSEFEMLLLVVQNAESMSVSEGKMRSNRDFYAPKEHFYGCSCSRRVYA